jgi:hypothetical protein
MIQFCVSFARCWDRTQSKEKRGGSHAFFSVDAPLCTITSIILKLSASTLLAIIIFFNCGDNKRFYSNPQSTTHTSACIFVCIFPFSFTYSFILLENLCVFGSSCVNNWFFCTVIYWLNAKNKQSNKLYSL